MVGGALWRLVRSEHYQAPAHGNLYFNKVLQVILWPPDAKSWLTGKDPDAGKDWWQEEKETTEDEMVGWHHRLDGHGFGWTPGVGDGQGGLMCCGSWGLKELDTTERLNCTRWFLSTGPNNNIKNCNHIRMGGYHQAKVIIWNRLFKNPRFAEDKKFKNYNQHEPNIHLPLSLTSQ